MNRRSFTVVRLALAGAIVAALASCNNAPPPKPPAPTPAPAKPAPTPDSTKTSAPHESAPPSAWKTSTATDDPTLLQAGGISSPKPATWAWQAPTAQFRTLQYSVPGQGSSTESGELIISVFPGANGGGPLDTNVNRWAGQFRGPDDAPATPTRSEKTVDGLQVTLVELKGSYTAMGAPGPKPNQLHLGAIVDAGDRRIFIRLIGPEATVEAERENWNKLIDGMRKQ